jgi:dihydrofolate reductase
VVPPEAVTLSLIAALSSNGVIGVNGSLPWHIPEDLRRFRRLTLGHPVVMGRKTYESILESLGKPLPGRENIVVTRQAAFAAPGCRVVNGLPDALRVAARLDGSDECCVIGGEEIFRLALPLCDRLELTEIHRVFEGDACFPPFDRREWQETARQPGSHEGLDYDFVTYQRRPKPK